MPYVYAKVDDLQDTEKVGTKQCVALLQHYANLPVTATWKEGKAVFGNPNIPKGTAIATFVNGKYESKSTGNHAAFYISQDKEGIWVMDQWKDDKQKKTVSKRYIQKGSKRSNCTLVRPSNNAEAYSIIE